MAAKKEDKARLDTALAHLAARDADMAAALAALGPPPPRTAPASFATLLYIIISQQVSTASARAISRRLANNIGHPTPARLLETSDKVLREAGFSQQKILYARVLADSMAAGRLSIAKLRRLPDDAAIETLCALKGIGRWSAEIFLLFSLRRPDVMPAQDLALQVAAQRLKRLPKRPKPAELLVMAEGWRPFRSYAARILWHFYRQAPWP